MTTPEAIPVCSVAGCNRRAKTKGMCKMHYEQWWRKNRGRQHHLRLTGNRVQLSQAWAPTILFVALARVHKDGCELTYSGTGKNGYTAIRRLAETLATVLAGGTESHAILRVP